MMGSDHRHTKTHAPTGDGYEPSRNYEFLVHAHLSLPKRCRWYVNLNNLGPIDKLTSIIGVAVLYYYYSMVLMHYSPIMDWYST